MPACCSGAGCSAAGPPPGAPEHAGGGEATHVAAAGSVGIPDAVTAS